MRILTVASICALAVVAQDAPAAAQTTGDRTALIAKADADVMAYYPAQAKAAGVEGTATMTCRSDRHGAARHCALVSEEPVGEGFGAAALRIAAASVDIDLDLTPAQADLQRPITLTFSLSPPSIKPNLLVPVRVREATPPWLRHPSLQEQVATYPELAARTGREGHASMSCVVAKDGEMNDCVVVEETPQGAGFGKAALELAHFFQIKPYSELGFPLAGMRIGIPVAFRMPPRP